MPVDGMYWGLSSDSQVLKHSEVGMVVVSILRDFDLKFRFFCGFLSLLPLPLSGALV